MVLKAEVLEIIERGDDFVKVFGSYCRGHKWFSPRGFEYTFKQRTEPVKSPLGDGNVFKIGNIDDIHVGMIWSVGTNLYDGKVTKWPDKNMPILGEIPSDEFFAKEAVEAEKIRDEERAERQRQIKERKMKELEAQSSIELSKQKKK